MRNNKFFNRYNSTKMPHFKWRTDGKRSQTRKNEKKQEKRRGGIDFRENALYIVLKSIP